MNGGKKMKRLAISCLIIGACFGLAVTGCKKKEEPVKENTEGVVQVATEKETEKPTRLKGRNLLTGEPMDEKIACKKPLAVMIGNTNDDAMPQHGIGQADILYEAPVEGGLTRLMPIFQDYTNIENLGSVRSCRYYYAYYAMEFDAIYMHYGQAYSAEEILASGQVEDLNGLDGKVDSLSITRVKDRKQPHNAFTKSEGIEAAIEYKGYDVNYPDDYTGHYQFAADGETIELKDGAAAKVVCPGYVINKPWLVYNEEDGLYYRYQYKAPHKDANDDTQLAFKNVIFQYADCERDGSEGGYLTMQLTGEGDGKYITNGKAIDITWKKESDDAITRYYDKNGKEIVLNQGKTNVCIVANSSSQRVGIYATEAEYEEAMAAN